MTRVNPNRGEPFVWLTSLGLAIGLIMIIGLLSVVLANGFSVFWPDRVAQVQTAGGPAAGEVVKRNENEWQLYTGNREVYGLGFRYIKVKDFTGVAYPPDILMIERMEYGDAVAYPVGLEFKGGETILAADPRFQKSLAAAVGEARRRWKEIRKIEKGDIGAINAKMEAIRIEEKKLSRSGQASKTEALKAKKDDLQKRFELLAAKARQLRARQKENFLTYRLPAGEDKKIPFGQIVHFYYPNRLNTAGRAQEFLRGIWNFLVDEPREANTEGGIFPAIFGTFVMTVIMSAAVTPFGIVAAIYLREYAKSGLLLRCVRIAVNNLAGVPSIVFGVFGLGFFVYTLGGGIDALFYRDALPSPTFGTGGILWASLTLALMTVPVVIVATEEAISAVPRGMREGSLACGASKWQTIQRIVLPASTPGIITGLILAMARGAGEVAPLMIVGVVKLAPSLPLDAAFPFFHLDRKFMHLGFHIYDLGFQSPDSEAAKPMVFATTLVLILLVVALNLAAIRIRQTLRRKYATAAF